MTSPTQAKTSVFPTIHITRAAFAIVAKNLPKMRNILGAVLALYVVCSILTNFYVKPILGVYSAILTIVWLSLAKTLLALPILGITLGPQYATCHMKKCPCWGHFWFNTCTCNRRFGRIFLVSMASLVFYFFLAAIIYAITIAYTPIYKSTHREVSSFILLILMLMTYLLIPVRSIPLWGTVAAGIKNPLSSAWHLSRGSWWRLFGGSVLVTFLPLLCEYIWDFTNPEDITEILIFLFIFTPLMVVFIATSQMISFAYGGLGFMFLKNNYAAPQNASKVTPQKVAPKKPPSSKGPKRHPKKS